MASRTWEPASAVDGQLVGSHGVRGRPKGDEQLGMDGHRRSTS